MKKPRGNKTSKVERVTRQVRAIELLKSGDTQEAIAALLGISRTTFWRDLQAIEARFVAGTDADVRQFKQAQYQALMKIESATAQGTIEPDVANALTRVRDSVAKLLGLNAPTKSISAHVNTNPEHSPAYLFFREAVAGLNDEQLHQVYQFARVLKRVPVVTVKDASWFPEPPKPLLQEGSE